MPSVDLGLQLRPPSKQCPVLRRQPVQDVRRRPTRSRSSGNPVPGNTSSLMKSAGPWPPEVGVGEPVARSCSISLPCDFGQQIPAMAAPANCAASVECAIAVVLRCFLEKRPWSRHRNSRCRLRAGGASRYSPTARLRIRACCSSRVGGHAAIAIVARQLEHREIQAVESGKRDELELVSHFGELSWKSAMVATRAWRAS